MIRIDTVVLTATAVVVMSWLSFIVIMITRPNPPRASGVDAPAGSKLRRDRRSMVGIALQGLAYAIVWSPPPWGLARILERAQSSMWGPFTAIWLAIVAALMVAGVALARVAIHALGKQWTLVAQTREGHDLVTAGPYAP